MSSTRIHAPSLEAYEINQIVIELHVQGHSSTLVVQL